MTEPYSWGLADVLIATAGAVHTLEDWQGDPVAHRVLAASCVRCGFEMPFVEDANGRPADCAVIPTHDCPDLPPEPDAPAE